MNKRFIVAIVNAFSAHSIVDRIECQHKHSHRIDIVTLDSVDAITDTDANDIEQCNVYFKNNANAKQKRIHFTANVCAYNQVFDSVSNYNVLTDIVKKSNYSQSRYNVDKLDAIALAFVFAQFDYLSKNKAINHATIDDIQRLDALHDNETLDESVNVRMFA
jgi:hypothetical protein